MTKHDTVTLVLVALLLTGLTPLAAWVAEKRGHPRLALALLTCIAALCFGMALALQVGLLPK
jgi:hypothetical protein